MSVAEVAGGGGGALLATIGAALNGTWSRPAGGGGLPLGSGLGWGGQAWLVVAGGISTAVVGPFDRPARGSADREARHRNHKTTRALDECDISPRIEKGPQAPLRHVKTWSPKIRHRVTGANWNQNCYVPISSNSCCMFKLNVR